MIRHIVLFKFEPGTTHEDAQVTAAREALTALGPTLPTVRGWQVRRCFGDRPVSHDLALVADFDNEDDLAAYAVDPEHRKVIAMLDAIGGSKAVADFEF